MPVIRLKLLAPLEYYDPEVEYRPAQDEEEFLGGNGEVITMSDSLTRNIPRLILKSKLGWEPVTTEEAIAAIKEPIVARFKDDCDPRWYNGKLCGITNHDGNIAFIDASGNLYNQCQVKKPKPEEKDITK